jgi:uncharacterized Zn finger protein
MEDGFGVPQQLNCQRCGGVMQETAGIASFGSEPGLRIFECPGCGAATSRLGTAKSRRSRVGVSTDPE